MKKEKTPKQGYVTFICSFHVNLLLKNEFPKMKWAKKRVFSGFWHGILIYITFSFLIIYIIFNKKKWKYIYIWKKKKHQNKVMPRSFAHVVLICFWKMDFIIRNEQMNVFCQNSGVESWFILHLHFLLYVLFNKKKMEMKKRKNIKTRLCHVRLLMSH